MFLFPEDDEDDEEDEDEGDDLLRRTGNFVASPDSLPSGVLRVGHSSGMNVDNNSVMVY